MNYPHRLGTRNPLVHIPKPYKAGSDLNRGLLYYHQDMPRSLHWHLLCSPKPTYPTPLAMSTESSRIMLTEQRRKTLPLPHTISLEKILGEGLKLL